MKKLELNFIDSEERVHEKIELADVPDEVYEEMFSSENDKRKVYFSFLDRMTFEEEWDTRQVNKHKDKILIAFTHMGERYKPVWLSK